MAKKYYWLKLQKDFFKRHDIRIIEDMDNGKDYLLFYMKLLCESVSHEGELRFSDTIPYNEKMLATVTNTNIDIVRSATKLFQELGMMDIFDDGTLYMSEVEKMLGSETHDAKRKREYRERKALELNPSGTLSQNCPTEIEIEKEKEIYTKEIAEIVSYLNEKANVHYRPNTQKTKQLITKLLKDNFTVEDFKLVIDKKCQEWMGTEQEKFLRPETLFSNKFEGYLNQNIVVTDTEPKPLTEEEKAERKAKADAKREELMKAYGVR